MMGMGYGDMGNLARDAYERGRFTIDYNISIMYSRRIVYHQHDFIIIKLRIHHYFRDQGALFIKPYAHMRERRTS
jgi:hypothetical protein